MRAKEKNHDYLPTAPNHVDLGGSKIDFLLDYQPSLDYFNIIKKITTQRQSFEILDHLRVRPNLNNNTTFYKHIHLNSR